MAKGRIVQYYAAIAASLSMVYMGAVVSWPSPVIPKFNTNETNIHITKGEISWMISLTAVGAIPGSSFGQMLADRLGRKFAVLATAVPATLGSIIVLFGKTPALLYVSRLLSGFSFGMIAMISGIYVAETADIQVRGKLGTVFKILLSTGNSMMFSIGPFVSYTVLNCIVLAIPFTYFILCLWIPESPYYYLRKGREDAAKSVLMRLQGTKDEEVIQQRLDTMKANVRSDMTRDTGLRELFTSPIYRPALYITLLLKSMQFLTGNVVITSYLESIFRKSSISISGSTISIIYGACKIISGLITSMLVDRVGRRPLLMVSSGGVGISLTAVGLFFYLQDVQGLTPETLKTLSVLPIAGILAFNILFTFGIGTLHGLITAEIFPTNVRTLAANLTSVLGSVLLFSTTISFQSLKTAFGLHIVFWLYAGVGFVGGVIIYFIVPETKGRSFQQIQDKLYKIEVETKPLQSQEKS